VRLRDIRICEMLHIETSRVTWPTHAFFVKRTRYGSTEEKKRKVRLSGKDECCEYFVERFTSRSRCVFDARNGIFLRPRILFVTIAPIVIGRLYPIVNLYLLGTYTNVCAVCTCSAALRTTRCLPFERVKSARALKYRASRASRTPRIIPLVHSLYTDLSAMPGPSALVKAFDLAELTCRKLFGENSRGALCVVTHAPARSVQKLNLRRESPAIQITCHGETGFYSDVHVRIDIRGWSTYLVSTLVNLIDR